MAEICCEVAGKSAAAPAARTCLSSPRSARKRRMEIRRFKIVPGVSESVKKRSKVEDLILIPKLETVGGDIGLVPSVEVPEKEPDLVEDGRCPRYGSSLICGRRKEMEDALSTVPEFFHLRDMDSSTGCHFFGVFDGHGCSHVATLCKDRMHTVVEEELQAENQRSSPAWKEVMERSFVRIDKEAVVGISPTENSCRCEAPQNDAVGSTAAVAIVTPTQVIVANCGDSRVVLCRNGVPVPLSSDHKPDRPDELRRIEEAGGRVIFWDCPRVLGVLAMSRAIGDNFLKPYVIPVPEVIVKERSKADDCLVIASDGLWDVMTNEEVCSVASRCLQGGGGGGNRPDHSCTIAATLLTKMAVLRNSSDNISVVVINLKSS